MEAEAAIELGKDADLLVAERRIGVDDRGVRDLKARDELGRAGKNGDVRRHMQRRAEIPEVMAEVEVAEHLEQRGAGDGLRTFHLPAPSVPTKGWAIADIGEAPLLASPECVDNHDRGT